MLLHVWCLMCAVAVVGVAVAGVGVDFVTGPEPRTRHPEEHFVQMAPETTDV